MENMFITTKSTTINTTKTTTTTTTSTKTKTTTFTTTKTISITTKSTTINTTKTTTTTSTKTKTTTKTISITTKTTTINTTTTTTSTKTKTTTFTTTKTISITTKTTTINTTKTTTTTSTKTKTTTFTTTKTISITTKTTTINTTKTISITTKSTITTTKSTIINTTTPTKTTKTITTTTKSTIINTKSTITTTTNPTKTITTTKTIIMTTKSTINTKTITTTKSTINTTKTTIITTTTKTTTINTIITTTTKTTTKSTIITTKSTIIINTTTKTKTTTIFTTKTIITTAIMNSRSPTCCHCYSGHGPISPQLYGPAGGSVPPTPRRRDMRLFPVLALLLPFLPGTLERCFCKVTGSLDDCACDVETIDSFNNEKLFPKLQKLLSSNYFKFYKDPHRTTTEEVNLNNPCPFWTDSGHCGLRDCAVKPCTPNEVPEGLKSGSYKSLSENSKQTEECEMAEKLGAVNGSLSDETRQALLEWNRHDDEADRFCMHDDEDSPQAQYVDLLLNPERYTGYKGPEAWQIWNSIYEENCFKPYTVKRPLNPLVSSSGECFCGLGLFWFFLLNVSSMSKEKQEHGSVLCLGLCVEKRAFFRLVSGLHASINVHLSARYLLDDNWFERKWGHNVTEFRLRFDEELTKGEGPKRLRNLYFLYLIELRALAKVLPFFEQPSFNLYTGQPEQDQENKELLLELLHMAKSFPLHFDEMTLFAGDKKEAAKLKNDFKLTFKNISRIMDCVGCFKCRLWGKLQTQGLGTALKILFSEKQIETLPQSSSTKPSFQLSRQEIVSLFNAFGSDVVSSSVPVIPESPQASENWRTSGSCYQNSKLSFNQQRNLNCYHTVPHGGLLTWNQTEE
ncbi:hypothetical protein NFI96_022475 [Prochilodus magdalenae]|nr:hypothetical protein NFI96_022475 [Prochilodus magdalenae]